MENPWEVLVVSSNLENRQDVAGILFRLGIDPVCLSSVDQCREIPTREAIDLVFCDRRIKGGDYRDVLSAVTAASGKTPRVVMMSDLLKPEEYESARHAGVFDVISSPCRPTDVEWMVILAKRDRRSKSKELLGASHEMQLLHKTAAVGA
jgi:DNA-binding NtrC family response regulator